jgi:radical SAM superfamily enzyme YgiQ (UPF0313 family)
MATRKSKTDMLFIIPPYRLVPPFNYKLIDPPRSLLKLATILKNTGYTVNILDMPILGLGFEAIATHIEKLLPKAVGIQNRSTYSFPIVEKAARCVKQLYPNLPVFVGGTYVSYNPIDALQSCEAIDYVLIGESEISLPHLVEALINNDFDVSHIKGIAYRDSKSIIKRTTPDFIPVEDLSRFPNPDLNLIPIHKYIERQERYIINLCRGCLFNCPYCTSEFVKGQIRCRTADHVLEEILTAYNRGFRNFYFFDNMFTANKTLVKEFCQKIVNVGISIKWPCMTNVGMVNDDLLSWMKRAGCDLIAYGIETMAKKALEDIGKHRQVKKIRETFEMTREHDIRPLAFVMFGLPNTTFLDELETIKFIAEIQPDAVRCFCFKPFPGTQFYSDPDKYGIRIIDENFSHWSILDGPTHETVCISKEEIIEVRMLGEYLFRSGGTISAGVKYRRRNEVQIFKTGEGGIVYNPYLPPEKRKTDMYLSGIKLTPIYFEVLYRCDGYHNLKDISKVIQKLFDMPLQQSERKVQEIIKEALNLKLLGQVPDAMAGRTIPITSEEFGAAVEAFVS